MQVFNYLLRVEIMSHALQYRLKSIVLTHILMVPSSEAVTHFSVKLFHLTYLSQNN